MVRRGIILPSCFECLDGVLDRVLYSIVYMYCTLDQDDKYEKDNEDDNEDGNAP